MENLKDYIVEIDLNHWDDVFICKAKNAKKAVDLVWKEVFEPRKEDDKKYGYSPTAKYELHATNLEHLYKENGNVVCLH